MAYCSYCGAALPDGARFCHLCGKEVQIKPHCPKCGAVLPEGSRFCSFCGTALPGAGAAVSAATAPVSAPEVQRPHQGRPPEIPLRQHKTITIPAPEPYVPGPDQPVPLPQSEPLSGVSVPAVCSRQGFTGSVQRFFGPDGDWYSFRGEGMYGFLEPFSMNYSDGQGPAKKHGGSWYYHTAAAAPGTVVEALEGAQILSSAPDGMYVYMEPMIYFVSPDGAMRPFMEAAETLTDLVCYRNWLFVTYLGPFEEVAQADGKILCCDRSYVVAYDRANGAPASIFERCAGVYYIDENVVILCDLMDSGEISRNVYKTPVRGWTEEGFRTLANYVGRIRGSLPFSKLILDSCAGRGAWKNPAECTANLRCCDWEHKMLAYQQKGTVLWRNFAGKPVSALGKL